MTLPTSTVSPALPAVELDVRHGNARAVTYALDGVDFLIGNVPGCDLRVAVDGPTLLCLVARHPDGVTLRKLTPTQVVLVNGQNASKCELADGDRVQIGHLDLTLRIGAVDAGIAFVDADRPPAPGIDVQLELRKRAELLEERALEIARQKQELATTRQEMTDLRQQLHNHFQDRRDKLAAMQDDLEAVKHDLDERTKKLALQEVDAAESRQRDRLRRDELDQRGTELAQRWQRLEEERRLFEQRQKDLLIDRGQQVADLEKRESALAARSQDLDSKVKHYEADVVRLHRLQSTLDDREATLAAQSEELTQKRAQLSREMSEMEEQLAHIDQWRAKLADEADRLARQKADQETLARHLAERGIALEGQQASLAVLRGRLERMRDEIRARQQQVDDARAALEAREAESLRKQEELHKLHNEIDSERKIHAHDREHWVERSAAMDLAIRQLKQAQTNLSAEDERIRREAQDIDERRRQLDEADGILKGRLDQLAHTQERLDLDRKALQERSVNLLEREQACAALQEQLHERSDEIARRHQEIADRLKAYQEKFTELDERRALLDQREQELQGKIDAWRQEIEKRQADTLGLDDRQRLQIDQFAMERDAHTRERAQFNLERDAALQKLTQARTELETMRCETLALVKELPDAELRAGAALERLGQAREQLRGHLGEIHQYVRQCQDELEQLRGKLQGDLDRLGQAEGALRREQDEHRLAAVAFRQQLIDWQGQIAELRGHLSRDETRLERRQSEVEERAREMAVQSQRLAEHAEVLHQQEQVVAEVRQEMDRHLTDMRQWYRQKLRELAGIPVVPAVVANDVEPTILTAFPAAVSGPVEPAGDEGDPGIVPTGRSILSIGAAADAGDQKLGQVLRELQLIEPDTLFALLAEARRQRRSLRQVLLASGVITLYQLALIEAGNLGGLMLGPVRVIDRVRHNAHETVYRVYDPRRGAEAVLRHLSEADAGDAVRPDEFRQRFVQAKLNDVHLANTLEVLELSGRPAALQEWLTGLPATDWPPLAAAPGVCYRLLTQAAQGLAAAHQAGVVHGHLGDALLLLTGDGVLKICGIGEPPWLIGVQHDEEPSARDDLRALGKIASSWCTPSGVRKGARTKPLPDALVSILYRLAAEGSAAYADVQELRADLEKAAAAIPNNSEAWDRLLKYVRENGAPEASLRQSA